MAKRKERGAKVKKKFTAKQRAFVREYAIDRNATQAAIRAGYKKKNAKQQGTENLAKPTIREAIEENEKRADDRAEKKATDIIRELERVGFSNMADYVEFGSGIGLKIKDISTAGEDVKRCVAEVAVTKSNTGGSLRFKLYDKVRALELLGRRFGMFKDVVIDPSEDMLSDVREILKGWDEKK